MSSRTERLLAIGFLFIGLWGLWRATAEQSFTVDEPYHLVAGLQMHQHGVNTVNLDHPPLVKWIAAWPLAGEPALEAPPLRIGEVPAAWMALFGEPATTRRYLLASRLAVVAAIVVPLLMLVYFWGRRFGPRVGFALVALLLVLPISLPYLPLVMTDAAAALGFVATVLAATIYAERPTLGRGLVVGLAAGLAAAAKFSGMLVAPAAVAVFFLAGRLIGARRASGHAAAAAGAAFLLLFATYALANPRGAPELAMPAIEDYLAGALSAEVGEQLAPAAPWLRKVARRSVELGQYTTGFVWLAARDRIGVFASVAFGQLSSDGRWWYFPALLLIQTPLALLAAAVAAGVAAGRAAGRSGLARWRRRLGQPRFVLPAMVAALYFLVACLSRYNLGLRHLLPILPFLLLPLAVWASRRPRLLAVLLALLLAENLARAPLWMSSTNTWWLGRHDPSRLAFSAFEYKQNLITLAEEGGRLEPGPLRVFYPLMEERELDAYFPAAEIAGYQEPLEPGWYAVNLQAEILLPAVYRTGPQDFNLYSAYRAAGRPWLGRLREIQQRGEDHGFIAGTFHLYRVP